MGEYSLTFPSRLSDEEISYSAFEHTFLLCGSYLSIERSEEHSSNMPHETPKLGKEVIFRRARFA